MRRATFILIVAFALVPICCGAGGATGSQEKTPEQAEVIAPAAPQQDPTPPTTKGPEPAPADGPFVTAPPSPERGGTTLADIEESTQAPDAEQVALDAAPQKREDARDDEIFDRVRDVEPVPIDDPGKIPEGQLRIQTEEGKVLALPLAHTSVEAEVSGILGRVWVTQYFTNPYDHPIEAVYVFPLPQMAAVDDMEMQIGERVIRGEMKKREEARRIYEEARSQGKTASLLEQERPNIFTQSVANILPGDHIRIRIRYVEDMKYEDGGYEFVFPMVVGPRFIPGTPAGKAGTGFSPDTDRVPDASRITPPSLKPGERSAHDIDVTLTLDAGVPVQEVKSPSHDLKIENGEGDIRKITLASHDTLPNKDLIIRYKTAGKQLETATLVHASDLGNYFMLLFQPEAEPRQDVIASRELVFVFDCSGSMSGAPIAKSKEAAKLALKSMREGDSFQIIKFSDSARGFSDKPVPYSPENLKRALQFVDQMRGEGGTQMLEGIKAALDYPMADNRIRIVAFMTDGYIGNDTEILAEIDRRIQKNTRLFSFGIGSSVNRYLLDRMAEAGRGYVTYVRQDEPADEAVQRFFRRIETPVLVDIDIKVEGGKVSFEDVYPARIPDLFAGQPLVVHGRFVGHGKATIVVTGMRGTKPFEKKIKVAFPEEDERNAVLGTLWARTRIKYFMDKMRTQADSDLVNQVTELAIRFRIMSQYTSFVAVEEKVRNEGGKLETVAVPVEIPEGVDYDGVFGATGLGTEGGGGYAQGPGSLAAPTATAVRRRQSRGNRYLTDAPMAAEEAAGDRTLEKEGKAKGTTKDEVRKTTEPDKGEDDKTAANVTYDSRLVVLSGPLSERDLEKPILNAMPRTMRQAEKRLAGVAVGDTVQLTIEVSEDGKATIKGEKGMSGSSSGNAALLETLKKMFAKIRFPARQSKTLFKFVVYVK